jgi:hypothetical protein
VPGGLSNVLAIGGGWAHSLALKSDGTVVAWGDNSAGQSTVPGGLSIVLAIAAGGYHSMALVVSPVSQAPTLQVNLSGTNITLSWPPSAQNFSLQTTTNLANPNSWITLTNIPVVVNLQFTVTNPISGGANFFRLKK